MSTTYKAIEVTKPGEFSLANKPLRNPGAGQVRIRVEACGVCHSDAATVDGLFAIEWPRVPGHEVSARKSARGLREDDSRECSLPHGPQHGKLTNGTLDIPTVFSRVVSLSDRSDNDHPRDRPSVSARGSRQNC
jgi:hypothetical protein